MKPIQLAILIGCPCGHAHDPAAACYRLPPISLRAVTLPIPWPTPHRLEPYIFYEWLEGVGYLGAATPYWGA